MLHLYQQLNNNCQLWTVTCDCVISAFDSGIPMLSRRMQSDRVCKLRITNKATDNSYWQVM